MNARCSADFKHASDIHADDLTLMQEELYAAYEAARVAGVNLFDTAEARQSVLICS